MRRLAFSTAPLNSLIIFLLLPFSPGRKACPIGVDRGMRWIDFEEGVGGLGGLIWHEEPVDKTFIEFLLTLI